MTPAPNPLDQVIWHALNTRQAHIAESLGDARRFIPAISVLAAVAQPTKEAFADLGELCKPGDRVSIWGENPYDPQTGFEVVTSAPLYQMVLDRSRFNSGPPQPSSPPVVETLKAPDVPDMIALTRLTKPGPFSKRTHELGEYIGIRVNGQLVAMCGERLRVPGYAEMSAICTHPDHTGKGYARLLMSEVACHMLDRGDTPILHVREDNARAIAVYQAFGFDIRHRRFYVVLQRV